MIIYKIKNLINGKVYIGQTTTSIFRRYGSDFTLRPANEHLKFSYKKYGADNFVLDILLYCTSITSLNYWEKFYIELYKSFDSKFGYNKYLGGDNRIMPIRIKRKLSKSGKQYFNSKQARIKSAIAKGSKPFNVYDKVSGKFVGTWINKKECGKELGFSSTNIRLCLRGEVLSLGGYVFAYPGKRPLFGNALRQVKRKEHRRSGPPFEVYDFTTKKLVGIWDNATTCAEDLNLTRSNIIHHLKGKTRRIGKYVFCFVDTKPNLNIVPINKKVICLNTKTIYPSVSEAARQLGLHKGSVSAVCLGRYKQMKGFIFKFLQDYENGA